MSELIAWLRGCLDDDERIARAAAEETGPKWYVDVERDVRADNPTDTPYVACGPWGGGIDASTAQHIARHDPVRALAEVDAKRAILDDCAEYVAAGTEAATDGLAGRTLTALTQPYAGRPGYREEWRA